MKIQLLTTKDQTALNTVTVYLKSKYRIKFPVSRRLQHVFIRLWNLDLSFASCTSCTSACTTLLNSEECAIVHYWKRRMKKKKT